MHGSEICWEGLENNLDDFGKIPSNHSTTDVIDPMSITKFEFDANKPQDVEMEFKEFKEKAIAIFEYKLFDIYTNGEINNNVITETSTWVDSKFIFPEYPGTFAFLIIL